MCVENFCFELQRTLGDLGNAIAGFLWSVLDICVAFHPQRSWLAEFISEIIPSQNANKDHLLTHLQLLEIVCRSVSVRKSLAFPKLFADNLDSLLCAVDSSPLHLVFFYGSSMTVPERFVFYEKSSCQILLDLLLFLYDSSEYQSVDFSCLKLWMQAESLHLRMLMLNLWCCVMPRMSQRRFFLQLDAILSALHARPELDFVIKAGLEKICYKGENKVINGFSVVLSRVNRPLGAAAYIL